MPVKPALRERCYRYLALAFYLLSTLQFVGYYILVCRPYLKLSDYLMFQEVNPSNSACWRFFCFVRWYESYDSETSEYAGGIGKALQI